MKTKRDLESRVYSATEVAELLGVSRSTAYKTIKRLNAELEANGYITVTGKISKIYFYEKVYF